MVCGYVTNIVIGYLRDIWVYTYVINIWLYIYDIFIIYRYFKNRLQIGTGKGRGEGGGENNIKVKK